MASTAAKSYRHRSAGRPNQPTPQTSSLMTDEQRAPKRFSTDRRQISHPVLAWERSGRTAAFSGDADDDAPWNFAGQPLYTREKINPATLIEQLRRPGSSVALNLLDDFDGLPPDAKTWDFYRHTGHWQNRLIHGDSAAVMASLIARDGLAGQVQAVYFDPPYGMNFKSNFQTATDELNTTDNIKGVPVGDAAPLRAFRDSYSNGVHSFLDGIHERLVLIRELLTESGSLFLQIGDENVHRLALVCDEVFGPGNRVATITWRPTGGSSAKTLPESASYLLWYAKDKEQVKYRQVYEELSRAELLGQWTYAAKVELADGTTRNLKPQEKADPDRHLPPGTRLYWLTDLTSQGVSTTGRTCEYEYDGVTYHCGDTRQWTVSSAAGGDDVGGRALCGLDRLAELGRLDGSGPGHRLHWKWYEDEVAGRRIDNVWHERKAPSKKALRRPNR